MRIAVGVPAHRGLIVEWRKVVNQVAGGCVLQTLGCDGQVASLKQHRWGSDLGGRVALEEEHLN